MFRWELGRQGSGYEKLRLFQFTWPIGTDCYLLRYPRGSYLPVHIDPLTHGLRHFRINLTLKKASKGGHFACLWPLFRIGRLCIFRSDLAQHCMSRVEEGSRIVLSVGVAL